VSRKLNAEEGRDGLVIISALYGKLPPSDLEKVRLLSPQGIQELAESIRAQFKFLKGQDLPVSSAQEYIDVTIAVQALVSNGQLHIPGGHSKSNLIGFYDPCYGEKKGLRITYQFQGRLHQVTVTDKQPVAVPLRGIFMIYL
jgi:DnaJ family protein C protein 11